MPRDSTVVEYDGTVDSAGALLDVAGENWIWSGEDITYSGEGQEPWPSQYRSMTIGTSAIANPVTRKIDAYSLTEGTGNAYWYVNTDMDPGVDNMGKCFCRSVYVRPHLRDYVKLAGIETGVFYHLSGAGSIVGYDDDNANGYVRSAGIYRVGSHWYRIWYVSYQRNIPDQQEGADDYNIYSADEDNSCLIDGVNGIAYYIWCPQSVIVRDGCPGYPGKPRLNRTDLVRQIAISLEPSVSVPSGVSSNILGPDGNRHVARHFTAGQNFSHADNDHQRSEGFFKNFQFLDCDHTITCYCRTTLGTNDYHPWSHSRYSYDGALLINGGAIYSRKSGSPYIKAVGAPVGHVCNDGKWHLYQVVRSGNTATVYVDGTAGTPADVSTYGIDNGISYNRNVIVGGAPDAMNYAGDILYVRVDREALTADQLRADRLRLAGLVSDHQDDLTPAYTRASVAFSRDTTRPLAEMPAGMPVISEGLIVEPACTNKLSYPEAFNSWQKAYCTIASDAVLDPRGDLFADTWVGGADGNRYLYTSVSALPVGYWTYSVYAKPETYDYINLSFYQHGNCYFDLRQCKKLALTALSGHVVTAGIEQAYDGWCRIWLCTDVTSVATRYPELFASADGTTIAASGGAINMTHLWGAQLESGKYPTSYCATTRSAVVTSLPVHSADGVYHRLNTTFNKTRSCTIKLSAKLDFSGAVQIGGTSTLIEVSGNTGLSSATRNRVALQITSAGKLQVLFYDNDSTLHSCLSSADPATFTSWHDYKLYLDFANLANSTITIDGVTPTGATWTSATGSATWRTDDCAIRLGHQYDGSTVDGSMSIRDVVVVPYAA